MATLKSFQSYGGQFTLSKYQFLSELNPFILYFELHTCRHNWLLHLIQDFKRRHNVLKFMMLLYAFLFDAIFFACESGNWDAIFTFGVPVSGRRITRYCDYFLPQRHWKIENRPNHGANLKIINRREQSCDESGSLQKMLEIYWFC